MTKQSGFANVLITIVALALIAGGIYYWQKNKLVTPSEEPIVDNQPPAAPVPDNDETKDWKTYRNEKYGFEFKYPAGHTPYSAVEKDQLVPSDDESDDVSIAVDEAKAICCEPISLRIKADETPELQNPDFQATRLNGWEALVKIGEGNLGSAYKTVYVKHPEGVWLKISQSGDDDFLNQILSTFKFINP